ncbi:aminodeoxychorismate lyase [Novosphingobium nitrogenifigens DSM 19370]|uniref:Endolytic murein transglycosylase n=1 Tax=Novosphingobium nitrogenifigens DSM 19370 TaxID=983920 RepID=F1ZDP0_9SPHN|nr:endolytic transglycosylase MltG [Novosphingobium nitrogenifigens]EGD57376.1 aminodeoxychorismate lyase [Novosphingobium nitrogenifigens DSM 19370]
MIRRIGKVRLAILAALLLVVGYGVHFLWGWYGPGPLDKDASFIVSDGAGMTSVAENLEAQGAIASALTFRARARLLGHAGGLQAGEFILPAHASGAKILAILQGREGVMRRLFTVPEGMPSALVYEKLMAQPLLTGKVDMPAEGSILPDSYDFQRGQSRADLVARMQKAMSKTLADLWAKRSPRTVAKTPEEAIVLASIVEKETGKPSERTMVAGLYSNRLKKGMRLQADPTIIYPITQGRPLGRRIRESEIHAVNDYNTYTMTGLPKGPITNPGRLSIEAVLNPAQTNALYMVADGTGGHVFADTLDQHNANVRKWFALRRARGQM